MRRRDLLGLAAASFGVAMAPAELRQDAARAASRHRIDRFEAIRIKVNRRGDWVLVRTHTSSGLSGLGDGSHGGDDASVLRLLSSFQAELRGRSIFSIEALRQWGRPHIDTHGRPAAVAISAIE